MFLDRVARLLLCLAAELDGQDDRSEYLEQRWIVVQLTVIFRDLLHFQREQHQEYKLEDLPEVGLIHLSLRLHQVLADVCDLQFDVLRL